MSFDISPALRSQNELSIGISTSSFLTSVWMKQSERFYFWLSSRNQDHGSFIQNLFLEQRNNQQIDFKFLEEVHVDIGPGSFTGLRVGSSFLKGLLGSPLRRSVYVYRSLDLLGNRSDELPMIHSRRGFVFIPHNYFTFQWIEGLSQMEPLKFKDNEKNASERYGFHEISERNLNSLLLEVKKNRMTLVGITSKEEFENLNTHFFSEQVCSLKKEFESISANYYSKEGFLHFSCKFVPDSYDQWNNMIQKFKFLRSMPLSLHMLSKNKCFKRVELRNLSQELVYN